MTARIGLIARCDNGGLGNMTWEFHRHVRPDRTLVVRLGTEGRGTEYPERFTAGHDGQRLDVRVTAGWPTAEELLWLIDGSDVVYTAETTYSPHLPTMCARQKVRLVVHVMPELFGTDLLDAHREHGTVLWVPTTWRHATVHDASLMPVPVATDRLADVDVREVRTMLHVSAPAMLDRNGTELLKMAIPHCRERWTLLVQGPESPSNPETVGSVLVRAAGPAPREYPDLYGPPVQALVLPRRYGGLSLPMQEAAACGLPVVTTNLAPQDEWVHPHTMVEAGDYNTATMKGGQVPVHRCSPERLAAVLDCLVADPPLAREAAAASRAHGEALAWTVWADRYREALTP